jgi:C1A family cysteine protease
MPRAEVPQAIDLREQFPAVYDQGPLGSCTAQALAAAFDFNRQLQGAAFMSPSRLFIYWNERDIEGTVDSDAGAMLRDGIKVLVRLGTPRELIWPYIIEKFTIKPPAHAYEEAEKSQALVYQRIMRPADDSLNDMLMCLNDGYPFVTGFSVYESFEDGSVAHTGIAQMPGESERLLGGHAVVVVGYDIDKEWFICRNSWGEQWGDKGHFYMPFAYLTSPDLASDQWTIRSVEIELAHKRMQEKASVKV